MGGSGSVRLERDAMEMQAEHSMPLDIAQTVGLEGFE